MSTKTEEPKVSKADVIRKYLKKYPDRKTSEVVTLIKEKEDMDVYPQQVSSYRSEKESPPKPRGRLRKEASDTSEGESNGVVTSPKEEDEPSQSRESQEPEIPEATKRFARENQKLFEEKLKQLNDLAEELGGTDGARSLLNLLDQLRGKH